MVEILLAEEACRGCGLCVDICPTEVFSFDEDRHLVRIDKAEDCIACLSCSFLCPSAAISQNNYHAVKNFYRDIRFSRRVEKFL